MARPREFDEAQALTAAREQFWRDGYAATSVNDLVAATGLSKSSLYGAFDDKHALFVKVYDDYCLKAIDDTCVRLDGPDEGALARIESYVRQIAGDCAERGCLVAKGSTELAPSDPVIAARAADTFGCYEDALTRAIEGAQRAGDLDPAAGARAQAGLLLAVTRGLDVLGTAGVDAEQLHRTAEAALAALPRTRVAG